MVLLRIEWKWFLKGWKSKESINLDLGLLKDNMYTNATDQ